MSKRAKYVILFAICIIAVFLRFHHLTTTPPGLYADEAIEGDDASQAATTGHYRVFYTEDNGREGLYVNLIAILLEYFHAPHEPWVVRLPAAIAGALTVPGVWFLASELFDDGAGLLSAFLLATSFWHINFSRIGFRAILAPFFLTWTLYLLLRAFRAPSSRAAWIWTISAGTMYGLGFYTYISYRITPLLLLLFIPFCKGNSYFRRRVFLFIATAFVTAAPIGWYFLKHPSDFFGRISQVSVTSSESPIHDFSTNLIKTALMFTSHGDENWRHNLSGAPELFWPVGILFLVGIVVSVESLRRYWRGKHQANGGRELFPIFATSLIWAWLVLGMLPVVTSDEGIPHALRSILVLPPTVMFAALGGEWLYGISSRWMPKGARTTAAFFLAVTAAYGYYEYFVLWANNPHLRDAFSVDDVKVGKEINSLPASVPKYLVVPLGDLPPEGMGATTIMFITGSFTPQEQGARNIHYINREYSLNSNGKISWRDDGGIPPGAHVFYIHCSSVN